MSNLRYIVKTKEDADQEFAHYVWAKNYGVKFLKPQRKYYWIEDNITGEVLFECRALSEADFNSEA